VNNSDKWDSSKKRSRFHIFFTIYINDLPDVVQNIANLFSDDTKVYAIVNKKEEQHSLHNDINNRVLCRFSICIASFLYITDHTLLPYSRCGPTMLLNNVKNIYLSM
jgi:hypothetical protein